MQSHGLSAEICQVQAETVWSRCLYTIATNAGISVTACALLAIRGNSDATAYYWLASIAITLFIRYLFYVAIRWTDLNRVAPHMALKLLSFGAFLTGIAWASLPFVVPQFDPLTTDAWLYLIMLGISIGAGLLGIGYRWLSLCFSMPIHLSVVVSVLLAGGAFSIVITIDVVVLTLLLYRACCGNETAFVESVARKLEAAALSSSLTAAHSEMMQANARLELLANCDPLTGLANRAAFNETLARAIREASKNHAKLGLLVLDLDRFKHVNDTMGHKAGDDLLTEFGQRLRNALPTVNTFIARLGGDEFSIIVTGSDAVCEATRAAEIVLSQVRKPFNLNGQTSTIGTSVGLALYPEHGTDADELFVSADMALYRSKEQGRGRWRKFDPMLRAAAERQRQIETDVLRAIEAGELEAWFQPQVCLHTHTVLGFEALVRWHHPTLGFIAPPEIVQAAHAIHSSDRLTGAVTDAACTLLRALPDMGLPNATVAINVSPREFALYSVSEMLAAKVARHGIRPNLLEIEITEEALLDTVIAGAQLKQLEQSGFTLAVDDFGAGHSSLTRLIDLKVDRLKIDRGIISGLERSDRNRAIISALIRLGEALSMSMLAEGVETESEAETLRTLGCWMGQGYLFARPMPMPRIASWLREHGEKQGAVSRVVA
ncbi:putative bifunctional diguanylate cyclase/phosphodiesterase [Rhizobium helianthi]|uniref:Bifunctional diguanylate cyclase/phosphodiesterase n=1 Tax=Rhizobium helianthi TaxID=1132695 RepID=A0ABW4LZU2_9HYPH